VFASTSLLSQAFTRLARPNFVIQAYAQGAAAEITAMITIGTADVLGLPVSTTHVLSSGVAGTMAANHSGLQWGTVRNLLMAWVLTLPASILLAAFLYWAFRSA
jgi:PiT family inorganic phosphate transporter